MSDSHLRKQDWMVRPCSLREAQRLVARYHYAGGGSNTATFAHGLCRSGNPFVVVGVAWWIPPTKAAALSVSPDWQGVLTLTRLAIETDVPTNAASFLLGRSIRLIRNDHTYHTLLTYADEGQGHLGKIYRATNWEYLGASSGDPVWVDPTTGRHVARKAGPKTRTAAQMSALGYVNTGKSRKHKFVMRLWTPGERKRTSRRQACQAELSLEVAS